MPKTTPSHTDPASPVEHALPVFSAARNRLTELFEALENEVGPPVYKGEAGRFEYTAWHRGDGTLDEGGGEAGLLRGRLFEKAGIHLSHVHGKVPEALVDTLEGAASGGPFSAAGLSLIAHPRSPIVPAAHMNLRIVSTDRTWFGGGADLTPMLDSQRRPDSDEARAFHAALEKLCDAHACADHGEFRAWCDRYFHLPHRDESRGIGGIFFDHLAASESGAELAFAAALAEAFAAIYAAIVRERMHRAWTPSMREQQLVRRGRYVEFNLLYDRGTGFGLKTGGNIAAILSSLPPTVRWP